MLGPHMRGAFRVTFLSSAINSRQSACCCALALEAMQSATLAWVGLVLFPPTETTGLPHCGTVAATACALLTPDKCAVL